MGQAGEGCSGGGVCLRRLFRYLVNSIACSASAVKGGKGAGTLGTTEEVEARARKQALRNFTEIVVLTDPTF